MHPLSFQLSFTQRNPTHQRIISQTQIQEHFKNSAAAFSTCHSNCIQKLFHFPKRPRIRKSHVPKTQTLEIIIYQPAYTKNLKIQPRLIQYQNRLKTLAWSQQINPSRRKNHQLTVSPSSRASKKTKLNQSRKTQAFFASRPIRKLRA